MAHFFIAKKLGYSFTSILFMPYGASISGKNDFLYKDEILIALAGPMLNLIFSMITVCMFWFYPVTYIYLLDFLIANVALFMFNMLPIYPLDFGRVVLVYMKKRGGNKSYLRFSKIINFLFSFVFLLLFLISIVFYTPNFSMLFVSIFIFISAFSINIENFYFISNGILKVKKDGVYPVKIFYAKNTHHTKYLLKYINSNYYSIFYLSDKNGKINKIIEERELIVND